MDQQEILRSLETYFQLMTMNGGAYIFQIAQKMGIVQAFKDGPLTSEEIAQGLGYKKQTTQLLLEGLVALNLLKQQENGKFVPTSALGFLKGNYQNLSADYWEHLPVLLKTGIPYKKMDSEAHSESEYKTQVKSLEWMMKPSAIAATQILGIGSKRKGLSILDVGAGSAVWSLAMLQADPSSKAWALDWPAVLEVAKASARVAGVMDRFSVIEGNYHEVPLKESYDLIIVGNVTHIETPEDNIRLFKKLKSALKPDGEIIVIDVFPGQEKGRLSKALYALGLEIRTEKGKVYHPDELKTFLDEAGFRSFAVYPIEVTPYTMGMLVAKE